ncbi:hypothetical protein KR52_00265 [Synechococcus sp. KORDI-52]|nr:hypothetical protein KR52_00265 [Synechococcus sp. KORDI-52]
MQQTINIRFDKLLQLQLISKLQIIAVIRLDQQKACITHIPTKAIF